MLEVALLHHVERIGGSCLRWLNCTRRREQEVNASGGLSAPGGETRRVMFGVADERIGGSCLR